MVVFPFRQVLKGKKADYLTYGFMDIWTIQISIKWILIEYVSHCQGTFEKVQFWSKAGHRFEADPGRLEKP